MTKEIEYEGKKYQLEVKWGGSIYCLRINGGGFKAIPNDCMTDMEKIKPIIIEAIRDNYDLKEIEKWNGKI